jgi:hypothetical protein
VHHKQTQNMNMQGGSQLGKLGKAAQSQGIHLRRAADGGDAQVAHVPVSMSHQEVYQAHKSAKLAA